MPAQPASNLSTSLRIAPFWRRRPVAATALVWGLLVAILGRSETSGDDESRYHNQSCTVIEIDGGNLVVDLPDGAQASTPLRLWGVDTTGSKADADTFLREQVLGTRVILVLAPHRSRDEEGRLLAYVTLEESGNCVNEMLLAEGRARVALHPENPATPAYRAIERKARQARRGMWASQPAATSGRRDAGMR